MFKIIGLEHCTFTDDDKKEVNFTRIYLTYPKEGVEGLAVEIVRVGSRVNVDGLCVGDNIEFYYNKYGKVSKIEIVG